MPCWLGNKYAHYDYSIVLKHTPDVIVSGVYEQAKGGAWWRVAGIRRKGGCGGIVSGRRREFVRERRAEVLLFLFMVLFSLLVVGDGGLLPLCGANSDHGDLEEGTICLGCGCSFSSSSFSSFFFLAPLHIRTDSLS